MMPSNGGDIGGGSSPDTITQLRLERNEQIKIVTFILTALGIFMAVMLFVFQTKLAASERARAVDQKTAELKQTAAVEVAKREAEDSKTAELMQVQRQALDAIGKNVDELMRASEIPKRRREPMPAGLAVDNIGDPP